MIAGAVLVGAGQVARTLDGRGFSANALDMRPASPAVSHAPFSLAAPPGAAAPAAPAQPAERGELPIVTYDSFDRRFTGPILAEAEKACWVPAVARGASEDIVYLFLDVAVDGVVQKVEPEEPPPLPDPQLGKLAELHQCIARMAKKVRFMPLPAPVRGARVAAHRHVQKD
jgi:hypothetical protein